MPFIYKITNTVNGKVYIGQTIKDVSKRFAQHIHNAQRERNYYDCALRRAIQKYGCDNFKIEIVEECEECMLNEREKYWIQYHGSFGNGYNETQGGQLSGHKVGVPLSPEHIQKLRDAHKRRDPSTYRGGARTPEAKAIAIAKFKATYYATPEQERKDRIRKASANRKPPMYWKGKEIPTDVREKISNTLKEKHLCPPHAIKVYCLETNETYRSFTEAERFTGVERHAIRRAIDGKPTSAKYHFKIIT